MAKFKRILLKLSGESLAGEQKQGINVERLNEYAQQNDSKSPEPSPSSRDALDAKRLLVRVRSPTLKQHIVFYLEITHNFSKRDALYQTCSCQAKAIQTVRCADSSWQLLLPLHLACRSVASSLGAAEGHLTFGPKVGGHSPRG